MAENKLEWTLRRAPWKDGSIKHVGRDILKMEAAIVGKLSEMGIDVIRSKLPAMELCEFNEMSSILTGHLKGIDTQFGKILVSTLGEGLFINPMPLHNMRKNAEIVFGIVIDANVGHDDINLKGPLFDAHGGGFVVIDHNGIKLRGPLYEFE